MEAQKEIQKEIQDGPMGNDSFLGPLFMISFVSIVTRDSVGVVEKSTWLVGKILSVSLMALMLLIIVGVIIVRFIHFCMFDWEWIRTKGDLRMYFN